MKALVSGRGPKNQRRTPTLATPSAGPGPVQEPTGMRRMGTVVGTRIRCSLMPHPLPPSQGHTWPAPQASAEADMRSHSSPSSPAAPPATGSARGRLRRPARLVGTGAR